MREKIIEIEKKEVIRRWLEAQKVVRTYDNLSTNMVTSKYCKVESCKKTMTETLCIYVPSLSIGKYLSLVPFVQASIPPSWAYSHCIALVLYSLSCRSGK